MKFFDVIGLYEAQQDLFEVEMSPSSLKKLAAAIPDVKVGMEFEMVVPDAKGEDFDDIEYEPDYGRDERADDIEDIVRFFGEEDDYMGQANGPRSLALLEEELREKFYEYMSEQVDEAWNTDEGRKYFANWVKENVDPEEIAEYCEVKPDLFGDRVPDQHDYDKFIFDHWEDQSSFWDEAYSQFRDEKLDEGDYSERDFLHDLGIRDMSDVANAVRVDITWPFYEAPYGSGDGEDIDSIGDDFSNAIGKRVYTSSSYHGARRSNDAYSLEPDSSIDASSGEAGLEFISPPMSVDEMLEDLKKVKEWADERGAYTNRSTGLHINVSVPNYSLDNLDYVKLAILLGDKYVLDQFGRLSNTYAKSSLDIIKDRAKDNEDVDRLLKQLKTNVEGIASKILHSGRTDKYTSINTKNNYVEFRSAGGDWLDRNFNKIEDTLLRFVVALDAACDPEKYKKEYYKGLYKVLKPKDEKSEMSLFSKYLSGQITLSQYANNLEKKRVERFRGLGIAKIDPMQVEEGDWEITYDDGTKSETIYLAKTDKVPDDEAAFNAAKKFKPNWFKPDTVEYITVKPYKFDPALDDLKEYRADFGHKYITVVAKNEHEAKEILKKIESEYFTNYPDVGIQLTPMETTKRKIANYLPYQESRIKTGEKWLDKPKIWIARGRPGYPGGSSRLYIAAVTRDEALDVATRLDPDMVSGDGFEIYVNDAYVDSDTYEAYQKAQEDLIKQREEERLSRKEAEAEADIDLDKLNVYRITNRELNNGYMYVVAENGGEAAEIASKMDPDKFGYIPSLTAQEQAGGTFGPLVITNMYKFQQRKLGIHQATTHEPTYGDNILFKTYYVTNRRASMLGPRTIIVQARNPDEAYHVAVREKPDWSIRDLDVSERQAPQQSSEINIPDELQPSSTRVSNMRSYRVENTETGESRYFAATDEQDAVIRAREQYPAIFPQGAGIYARPHEPGIR